MWPSQSGYRAYPITTFAGYQLARGLINNITYIRPAHTMCYYLINSDVENEKWKWLYITLTYMRAFHLETGSTKILTCWQWSQCLGLPGLPKHWSTLNCNIFGQLKYCSYLKLKTWRLKSNVDPHIGPAILCMSSKCISPKCMVSKWNTLTCFCASRNIKQLFWFIQIYPIALINVMSKILFPEEIAKQWV